MSWRAESTFKPSSALSDEEKEFLKIVKKIREIQKLQEKLDKGENLLPNQLEKVNEKENLLKSISALAGKLPGNTEVLDKNQDIVDLLPRSATEKLKRAQKQTQEKEKQDEIRREQRAERQREERNKPIFMTRHDRPILAIAVSQDGYIFTCSKDKFVLCWSMESTLLSCVCTYAGHRGAVRGIDFTPGRLISGDSDGKIMLWDTDVPKKQPCTVSSPISTFEDGGNVQVLRWCPFDEAGGTQRFASACEKLASKPAAIAVWSATGRKADCVFRIENLPGKANDIRWAGGAKTKLLSAHDNGFVGVWSAEPAGPDANYLLKTIKLHDKPIASLCLSADGKSLITASHDASSKVVNISTRDTETLKTYKADRPLNAVDVTMDFTVEGEGNLIVAGGRDPMVVTTSSLMEDEFEAKILETESGQPIAAAKGHFGPVHDLVFMPWLADGGGFATCSEDGCLRVHALDGRTIHSDKIE
jgi:WD40 repeat protein